MSRLKKEEQLLRERILSKFPLYKPEHEVYVHASDAGNVMSLCYQSNEVMLTHGHEHEIYISMYIAKSSRRVKDKPKTIFLLDINLAPCHCGKGLGLQLYGIVEEIGRHFGCTRYEQTPSGWTHTGETREEYLLRHGFKRDVHVVYKEIKHAEDVLVQ